MQIHCRTELEKLVMSCCTATACLPACLPPLYSSTQRTTSFSGKKLRTKHIQYNVKFWSFPAFGAHLALHAETYRSVLWKLWFHIGACTSADVPPVSYPSPHKAISYRAAAAGTHARPAPEVKRTPKQYLDCPVRQRWIYRSILKTLHSLSFPDAAQNRRVTCLFCASCHMSHALSSASLTCQTQVPVSVAPSPTDSAGCFWSFMICFSSGCLLQASIGRLLACGG